MILHVKLQIVNYNALRSRAFFVRFLSSFWIVQGEKMTIVCTGSIAYDYLMKFPGLFKEHILPENIESLSLSFLVESLVRLRGGIAPNIAYTLALLGEKLPIVFATVGEDFYDYGQWLAVKGVDISYIKVIAGEFTASFFANTDLANSQIASFYPGAMACASEYSLTELKIRPDLVVISPNDPQAMINYVEECIDSDIPYFYDPSQQIVRMDGADIRRGVENAYSLFVNEYEYKLLLKHTGLSEDQIRSLVKFTVVTCGEKGSIIYMDNEIIEVPCAVVQSIVDPTGVGDAYRGGFIRGFLLGFDLASCGRMGAVAAAYCLEEKGTQAHTYTIAEFTERYQQNFGIALNIKEQ